MVGVGQGLDNGDDAARWRAPCLPVIDEDALRVAADAGRRRPCSPLARLYGTTGDRRDDGGMSEQPRRTTSDLPLPAPVAPMLATLGPPPTGDGWGWEFKWDGYRALAAVAGERLALWSRSGRGVTDAYPELAGLPTALSGRAVLLDGEIVAPDEQGRPSFSLLQQRNRSRPDRGLVERVPVQYYVFDVLVVDGEPVMGLPYEQRRALLEDVRPEHERVVVPPTTEGMSGEQMLAIAREHGLEGVVAKRRGSLYRPGRRSPDWIKVPLTRRTEVVVGGWTPGEGRRHGSFGAVLVGAHDEHGDLVYLGRVGTGWRDSALRTLRTRLDQMASPTCPFASVPREVARQAHWVRPELVGEVRYRELTSDGFLRGPAWLGDRPDRAPSEIGLPSV